MGRIPNRSKRKSSCLCLTTRSAVAIAPAALEYINHLRSRGYDIEEAAVEGDVLRLRPIMMTMLVHLWVCGLQRLSHGIGSDSQRPFAIAREQIEAWKRSQVVKEFTGTE